MQKAVEIQSQGLTLRGMIHIPDGITGKVPVVAIFHGFTGNKMEPHFIFVKLSRFLEKHGIASVRFDFGGSGESDGDFSNMTLSGELDDALNILDYIKTLEFADINHLGVVGLSMGGAVASMLAGTRKDDIKALCLWAPAGNMGELVMTKFQPEATRDEILHADNSNPIDLGGLLLGMHFVKDVLTLDIFDKAASYDKHVLLIHGDKDQAVPLQVSERYLEIYGTRARLHVINNCDHTFNKHEWEVDVLQTTVDFMMKELTS